jgi:hypothetical protein
MFGQRADGDSDVADVNAAPSLIGRRAFIADQKSAFSRRPSGSPAARIPGGYLGATLSL